MIGVARRPEPGSTPGRARVRYRRPPLRQIRRRKPGDGNRGVPPPHPAVGIGGIEAEAERPAGSVLQAPAAADRPLPRDRCNDDGTPCEAAGLEIHRSTVSRVTCKNSTAIENNCLITAREANVLYQRLLDGTHNLDPNECNVQHVGQLFVDSIGTTKVALHVAATRAGAGRTVLRYSLFARR